MAIRGRVRKVSAVYLERAAFHYLGRFASSRANLGRVLERKVRRRHADHGPPSPEEWGWIEAVILKCERLDLVDDEIYARSKARSMHRAGKSLRRIRAYLFSKGTKESAIKGALAELTAEHEEPDLSAAAAFARKRRLGPYRGLRLRQPPDQDPDKTHQKELASLARAGFGFGIASRILACRSPSDVDALLTETID